MFGLLFDSLSLSKLAHSMFCPSVGPSRDGSTELAISSHREIGAPERSREGGCDLQVVSVRQAEHIRQEPLRDGISTWWSRIHNIVQRVLRHRRRSNGI
eukprot:4694117-Pyramimonas_sp.AAC.1